jgi:hypothetical protein
MAKKRVPKRKAAPKVKATKIKGTKGKATKVKAAKLKKAKAKETSLAAHLNSIKSAAVAMAAAGGEKGACLVADPQTGQNRCIRTDAATCKSLKGVFIGGPCGG